MLQKIQRISIPEGGRGRGFTTGKLETALQGGGSCFWVPLSAVRLGRLSAHKNGTYKAEEAGVYGYSEAVINVNSYVTNGNRIIYPDSLEEAELPCALEIVYLPTRVQEGLPYKSGERIDTSGLLVRALMEDGSVWPDSPLGHGFVPYRELIIEPERADMDEAYTDATSELVDVPVPVFSPPAVITFAGGGKDVFTGCTAVTGWQDPAHPTRVHPVLASAAPFDWLTYDIWPSGSEHNFLRGPAHPYTVDGKTVWWQAWDHPAGVEQSFKPISGVYWSQNLAWTCIYGTLSGYKQLVTVSWARPGDGMLLSTEFEIYVAEGGPSAHSGSSHSSQPIGGNN